MQYETGGPTKLTFDTYDEIQALGWAASDMRRVDPDDPDTQSAYQSALRAAEVRHNRSEEKDFTLEGEKADTLLSILQRWVEAGPPQERGQVTDAARTRSYRTACAIVAKTVKVPTDSSPTVSS